jgi:hypothetical protein
LLIVLVPVEVFDMIKRVIPLSIAAEPVNFLSKIAVMT